MRTATKRKSPGKSQGKDNMRYDKRKFMAVFATAMLLFAAVRYAFGIEVPMHMQEIAYNMEVDVDDDEYEDEDEELATYESEEQSIDEAEDKTFNLIPPTPNGQKPHRIKGVWSYVDCFPDVQDVQIVAAKRNGVRPLRNRKEAEKLVKKHKLVNICHSPFYVVDPLTHSIPYLVPKAQHLLNTICLNFIDSCQMKGLPVHLPMITSVMRTTDDVSNLQQGNKNATTNSCHCYGTTVDIAYNRFQPLTGAYDPHTALLRWNEPMKQVLAEVLNDLRRQNRCYVKYERKQGCFHLTCR